MLHSGGIRPDHGEVARRRGHVHAEVPRGGGRHAEQVGAITHFILQGHKIIILIDPRGFINSRVYLIFLPVPNWWVFDYFTSKDLGPWVSWQGFPIKKIFVSRLYAIGGYNGQERLNTVEVRLTKKTNSDLTH